MSQLYKDKKEKFDSMVYGYLVKRLTQPLDKSDACGTGHIDERGNELNPDEDWSYTKLDKLVFDLRAALGDKLSMIVKDSFDGVDSMALMSGPVDTGSYREGYGNIVKLVEEAGYLPESTRGQGGSPEPAVDSGMDMDERVSFALTVATAIMVSLLKDRLVTAVEFDNEVLPDTEATFGVRSVGDSREVLGYLRSAGLSNGRDVTSAALRLLSRISKEAVAHGLLRKESCKENLAGSWVEVSHA